MMAASVDWQFKHHANDRNKLGATGHLLFLLLASFLPRCISLGDLKKASYKVEHKYPHEKKCFSEGLVINGSSRQVFESCGLYGKSYLKRMSLDTGNVLQRGQVPKEIFSEGIALLGSRLFMLTYKKKQVLEYDVNTFKVTRRHSFPYGQGWGLTTDGCDLLATTGSQNIYRLRPDASGELQLVKKVAVVHKGKNVNMLNELEYITPKLWVNQWHTNFLLRVHPDTGVVELQIDLTGLHSWRGEATPNGIGYSAAMDEGLLIATGKLWPQMFALRVSAADLCGAEVAPVGSQDSPLKCAVAPRSACHHPSKHAALPAQVPTSSPSTKAVTVAPTLPPSPVVAIDPTMAPAGASAVVAESSTMTPAPPQSPIDLNPKQESGKLQPASAGKSAVAAVSQATPGVIVESAEEFPLASSVAPPAAFTALATVLSLVLFFAAVALPCVVKRHRHAPVPSQPPNDYMAERVGV